MWAMILSPNRKPIDAVRSPVSFRGVELVDKLEP
jgi:hypothetical protein